MHDIDDYVITEKIYKKFQNNINKTNYCWLWLGGTKKSNNGKSYGSFYIKSTSFRAHRISFYIYNDLNPGNLEVCHNCDNPLCVNPEHLFLVTRQENATDAFEKGRMPKGKDHTESKLTEEQIKEIRFMASLSMSHLMIANKFKVSRPCIHSIVNRRTWKHI
jgi:hypothetical protein